MTGEKCRAQQCWLCTLLRAGIFSSVKASPTLPHFEMYLLFLEGEQRMFVMSVVKLGVGQMNALSPLYVDPDLML